MELNKAPLFAAMRAKMEWLSERQKILAENIANADTPGFKARDLKPVDFTEYLKNHAATELALTNPMHIKGGRDAQRFNFTTVISSGSETDPSGNSVAIEEQMMKIGETQMEYESATGIYRKNAQMMKIALGRQN
ncbi:MAG: flagellar basal body rod protein FlgB [Pseudomonadota bacterium]|jgi:flagellar basal-body rod protein FlgB|nr:flagellar basal body rod protein FlgB [Alphaproteobacteria bacterium]